jgi:hypothetical protein
LACPLCARETDSEFNKNQQHHLTVSQIQKHFDTEFICNLDKMFMCGNYGDPAAGKHTLELYKYFRSINPSITLGMNTNGALQNTNWWRMLANIFNQPRDYVVFSIDGLEDTNHLYRKNCNWSNLMKNAQAFINAGGSAHWDMLVYQHNQHQVEECEKLAKNMGFKWFRAKVSKRPLTEYLQYPVNWQIPKLTNGNINCHALIEKSIYIDSHGRISPCCWLGTRQSNFITDFDSVQASWKSDKPNNTCVKTCSSSGNESLFLSQWKIDKSL